MLSDVQYLLNRLYTEAPYRARFFSGREQFYTDENISEQEVKNFLKQLKQEQVEFFAKGLISKRAHAVKALLPLTAFTGAKIFDHEFITFCAAYLPAGIHKHHEDALAFTDALKKHKHFKQDPEKSILRFEADIIRQFLAPAKWSVRLYACNPVLFRKEFHLDQVPALKKRRTLVIWKKGIIVSVF